MQRRASARPEIVRGTRLALLTSGGDAPGMNAAIRAVVRAALRHGCEPYAVMEGLRGLVAGALRPMAWDDVCQIGGVGGTVIRSARCAEFLRPEVRRRAVYALASRGIDRLVVIGGDGSLTGADVLRAEWQTHMEYLVSAGELSAEVGARHAHLMVVGLAGSIDNDMAGTEMTIGAMSSLHRITEAIDCIHSTAASHQRAFIIEVMGRKCGWLALKAALCVSADWVLIPEHPPAPGWEARMCAAVVRNRALGRTVSIVIVAEGAVDRRNAPIRSEHVRDVLLAAGLDARLTTLGHIQRGGVPSAYDRALGALQGVEAAEVALSSDPASTPALFVGLNENRLTVLRLDECVARTAAAKAAMDALRFSEAMALRGVDFCTDHALWQMLRTRAPPDAPTAAAPALPVLLSLALCDPLPSGRCGPIGTPIVSRASSALGANGADGKADAQPAPGCGKSLSAGGIPGEAAVQPSSVTGTDMHPDSVSGQLDAQSLQVTGTDTHADSMSGQLDAQSLPRTGTDMHADSTSGQQVTGTDMQADSMSGQVRYDTDGQLGASGPWVCSARRVSGESTPIDTPPSRSSGDPPFSAATTAVGLEQSSSNPTSLADGCAQASAGTARSSTQTAKTSEGPSQAASSLRIAVLNCGAPCGGMNAVTAALSLYCAARGHVAIGVADGFAGLARRDARVLRREDIIGLVGIGGSILGTNRMVPGGAQLPEVASAIDELGVDGLVVVGGFEALRAAAVLEEAAGRFSALHIPVVVVPATISNNVPGTEFSVGCDTALNVILQSCDYVRQSASASRKRAFVLDVQGGYCGFLATMAALAAGASLSYIHEEGVSLAALQADARRLRAAFLAEGSLGRLVVRNEKCHGIYTAELMSRMLEDEAGGAFDSRWVVLGHVQQGGPPSPLDRVRAVRHAVLAAMFVEAWGAGDAPGGLHSPASSASSLASADDSFETAAMMDEALRNLNIDSASAETKTTQPAADAIIQAPTGPGTQRPDAAIAGKGRCLWDSMPDTASAASLAINGRDSAPADSPPTPYQGITAARIATDGSVSLVDASAAGSLSAGGVLSPSPAPGHATGARPAEDLLRAPILAYFADAAGRLFRGQPPRAVVVGIRGPRMRVAAARALVARADMAHRRPARQWWMHRVREVATMLAFDPAVLAQTE